MLRSIPDHDISSLYRLPGYATFHESNDGGGRTFPQESVSILNAIIAARGNLVMFPKNLSARPLTDDIVCEALAHPQLAGAVILGVSGRINSKNDAAMAKVEEKIEGMGPDDLVVVAGLQRYEGHSILETFMSLGSGDRPSLCATANVLSPSGVVAAEASEQIDDENKDLERFVIRALQASWFMHAFEGIITREVAENILSNRYGLGHGFTEEHMAHILTTRALPHEGGENPRYRYEDISVAEDLRVSAIASEMSNVVE